MASIITTPRLQRLVSKAPSWKELADAVGVELGPEEPEEDPEGAGAGETKEQVLAYVSAQLQLHRFVTFRHILEEFAGIGLSLHDLDAMMDEGARLGLLALDPERTLAMRVGP